MIDQEDQDIEQMDAGISAWTAGSLLKEERERKGLSEKAVADRLHITMHYVKAIEADRFEKLPGSVFARGYLRNYAQILGLDENEILSLFDDAVQADGVPESKPVSGVNTGRRMGRFIPWLMLAVLAFLIGYLVFWAVSWFSPGTTASGPGSAPASTFFGTMGPGINSAPAFSGGRVLRGIAPTAGEPAATLSAAFEGLQEQTGSAAPAPQDPWLESDNTRLTEVVNPGPDLLEIRFSGRGWIDISGPDDQHIYRDIHRPGDIIRVSGRSPFSVQIGAARSVDIRLNEQQVELEPEIRIDNTARLVIGN